MKKNAKELHVLNKYCLVLNQKRKTIYSKNKVRYKVNYTP